MIDPRVASGLRDLTPAVMIPREQMLAAFRQVFAGFGFLPIDTPHIERMEVLTGKGAGSDEVLRQIFEVTNKGGTPGELALRFDLTVPLARFVARHIDELGTPFKRYAIGSVFRGERPAKGRFREFVQCDFDTIGTESAIADAETAQMIHAALTAAGVPEFTITLNNRKILDGFLQSLDLSGRSGTRAPRDRQAGENRSRRRHRRAGSKHRKRRRRTSPPLRPLKSSISSKPAAADPKSSIAPRRSCKAAQAHLKASPICEASSISSMPPICPKAAPRSISVSPAASTITPASFSRPL